MKRTILAFAAAALLFSCKEEKKPSGNLHLTGEIKGLKKGTLYIQKIKDTALVSVDTIIIDGDSHFESYLNIASPEMYYIFLDRGVTSSIDNSLQFFAEPGEMNIATELEGYYSKAKITGSKNQEFYEEYKKINTRFNDQRLDYKVEKLRAEKLNKPQRVDSLQNLEDQALKRKYLYTTNFAINHRDYEISPYIALAEINDINLKYLDTIRKSMTPKVAGSYYGKKLTAYFNARKKAEQQ